MVNNPSANAGNIDTGLIPGSGRYPGRGHGNPLQYSCLENPVDRETWRAMVHGVAKGQTRLKRLTPCTQDSIYCFLIPFPHLSVSHCPKSVEYLKPQVVKLDGKSR